MEKITGNEPAIPSFANYNEEGELLSVYEVGCKAGQVYGLTIRHLFAKDAPPVPDWFKHKQPEKNFTKIDISGLTEEQKRKYDSWKRDSEWDLPEDLKWLQDLHDKIYEEGMEWKMSNSKERFFQWRTFYADALIDQLNKEK